MKTIKTRIYVASICILSFLFFSFGFFYQKKAILRWPNCRERRGEENFKKTEIMREKTIEREKGETTTGV